jgi:DNA-binding transcriptional regulator LsrR (DeoR family)
MGAGRPKTPVNIEQVAAMTNAGLTVQAIAKELGICRSTVNRLRQEAQSEGVLGVKLRQPKTVAATVARTTVLDRRDRAIVVYALGVAIQHEVVALERCCEQLRDTGMSETIRERQRSLKELTRTRQRLTRVS